MTLLCGLLHDYHFSFLCTMLPSVCVCEFVRFASARAFVFSLMYCFCLVCDFIILLPMGHVA